MLLYVCLRPCVCVYVCVYVTFLLSILKFKPFVWIQSRASARGKHSGGLNNSTFLLACTAQSPVRSNNKVELFRRIRRSFCDTIQASAQLTRHDNRAMRHRNTDTRKQSGTQLKNPQANKIPRHIKSRKKSRISPEN